MWNRIVKMVNAQANNQIIRRDTKKMKKNESLIERHMNMNMKDLLPVVEATETKKAVLTMNDE